MRLLARAAAPLALLAMFVAGPSIALAHGEGAVGSGWQPHSYVYLDNNTAGANTISGFSRSADGALTALPGSPFPAGGAGLGAGLASQGAVQTADHGRYLLAVDAGSNQISVLRIGWNGSLTPTPGSPFASGGVEPDSIAVSQGLVYVSNTGAGGTNYTGFNLSSSGRLYPIPGSTVTLPAGSGPGEIVLNSNDTKLAGMRVTTSLIDSFTLDRSGRPHAAPGSPYPAQGLGPFGSQFRPTNPNQLFVDNAHNGTGLGTVSAFTDLPSGALSSIGASPFADFQTAPCWQVISPDGRYLYALDTGSAEISTYAIAWDGTLTLLSNTPLSATPGVTGTDVALSPDGRTLYVNMGKINGVAAFSVHGGTVTQLPGSPTPESGSGSTVGITVS
ncbi:MAG TPA: beta-propeller fold lactonase family protein [Solirubrobacteraceae bacterium]|nr:beta-propeller fold lactonase family protein [Solirubrobacteraceae bacterium]